MSLPYSGNVAALKVAKDSLKAMGCNVLEVETYSDQRMRYEMSVTAWITHGKHGKDLIGYRYFSAYDTDILYNTVAYWLTHLAEQLAHWK